MGVDRADDAAGQENGSTAYDTFARRVRCDPLHCNDRMPMAHVAQQIPIQRNTRHKRPYRGAI